MEFSFSLYFGLFQYMESPFWIALIVSGTLIGAIATIPARLWIRVLILIAIPVLFGLHTLFMSQYYDYVPAHYRFAVGFIFSSPVILVAGPLALISWHVWRSRVLAFLLAFIGVVLSAPLAFLAGIQAACTLGDDCL